MQEKIYHHGLNNKVLTRAEQDEMFRELNRMQQDRMRHFAELLANEPRLVSQYQGHNMFNLSAFEERVHLPLHTLFTERGRDPEEQLSPTFRHGGTVRGVVHRYPRMSDNLPKGTIKFDRSEVDVRITNEGPNGEDWFRAMAFGLTMNQMGAITLDSVPPEGSTIVVDYKTTGDPIGPQQTGRVNREPVWQSTQRDRAATSAPVRKKLRDKTRAQKKARRKQR
ncbi:hypothetical protein MPK66_gp030 [Erwinia phage pEa_SNUABM_2]|uniref:Uncharacterized protein n=1 Tax=Erwinia phage pEa_SNUABM_2 TaxID=2869547 RepID=A0AAE8C1G5_9CAUD|nr:hypothetical protein MPK66_gp030 [Erwinia phage pEa_SNUABM_2]QZE59274.1 hypothetical protein pEaSNUABM2_00030 [Erwinia phage pEa_SNUABM_2]QZE59610.1 hypothetical protein pEaSNUABM39_00030 [Erwinia phage pEa_SNUABM_39]